MCYELGPPAVGFLYLGPCLSDIFYFPLHHYLIDPKLLWGMDENANHPSLSVHEIRLGRR